METPSQSYGTSLAVFSHSVYYLPPDTSERAPQATQAGIRFTSPEGWKAELT